MILLNAHDHDMISPYRRTSVLRHMAFQAHGSIVQEPFLSLHIIHKENRKWHLLLVKGDHILSFPVVQSTVVNRGTQLFQLHLFSSSSTTLISLVGK